MGMGSRIALAIERRGMRPTNVIAAVNQTAQAWGVKPLSQQSLSVLVARDSDRSEHVLLIADALSVSFRWLMNGQGDMDATDWPFPDGELLQRVLRLPHDALLELQGVLRASITVYESQVPDRRATREVVQAIAHPAAPAPAAAPAKKSTAPRHHGR